MNFFYHNRWTSGSSSISFDSISNYMRLLHLLQLLKIGQQSQWQAWSRHYGHAVLLRIFSNLAGAMISINLCVFITMLKIIFFFVKFIVLSTLATLLTSNIEMWTEERLAYDHRIQAATLLVHIRCEKVCTCDCMPGLKCARIKEMWISNGIPARLRRCDWWTHTTEML